MKAVDEAVNPFIETFEAHSLGTARKGLVIRVKDGISVNNVCEGPQLVPAQFPQREFTCHVFPLQKYGPHLTFSLQLLVSMTNPSTGLCQRPDKRTELCLATHLEKYRRQPFIQHTYYQYIRFIIMSIIIALPPL